MIRSAKGRRHSQRGSFVVVGMLLSVLLILAESPRPAFAQGTDVEPNNTCLTAQNVGAVTLPFTVEGALETPPETPDVDFFRFTGTPGAGVQVDLEGVTLPDPLLGLFDSSCNLLAVSDDAVGFNSRLQFVLPSDGVFILAATSCCDFGFTGNGGSSGSYRVTIAPILVAESISGRIVDAVSGTPLRGDVFPFALVELRRCQDNECFEFVNAQNTDSEGRFRFSSDFNGFPLTVGRYQVVAFAEQFEQGQTAPFDLGEGVDREVGDLLLTPLPIQFFAVDPCGNIAPTGGTCAYSVRVRNSSPTAFEGRAWSIVSGFGIGSPANETLFQTGTESGNPNPQVVVLEPAQSTFLQFQFEVPGTVAELAMICAEALVGQDPAPLFTTVGRRFLFCISKEGGPFSVATKGGTFQLVPENKARKLFQKLKGKR
jgi:5-hydroxyisourate hydrolase-like protein (transthyretin family)